MKAKESLSWFMRILMFFGGFDISISMITGGISISMITGLAILLSIGRIGIVPSSPLFLIAFPQLIFVEYLRNTGYRKKYTESWRWILYGVIFYFGLTVLKIISG